MSVYSETLDILIRLSKGLDTHETEGNSPIYPVVRIEDVTSALNISSNTLIGRLKVLIRSGEVHKGGNAEIIGNHYGYTLYIVSTKKTFLFSLREAAAPQRPEYPCVYLFKCHEFIKIGFTSLHPTERLKQISYANPYPVKLLFYAVIPNADEIELQLHESYKHRNVKGEWFLFTRQEQADIIKTLKSYEVKS